MKLIPTYTEADADDRFRHDAAIDFLEKSVLPTPIQNLKLEQLEKTLAELNYLITSAVERDAQHIEKGRSLYRRGEVEVLGFPGFDPDFKAGNMAIAYLEKNDPENVATYYEFAKLYHQFAEAQRQNPEQGKFTLQDKYSRIAGNNEAVQALIHKYVGICPHHELVPKLMQEFMQNLVHKLQAPNHDPVQIAAWAHMEFVYIHPFVAANGRTARALMNTILAQHNLPTVAFMRNKQYMKVVSRSIETRDYRVFEEYLRRELKKTQKYSNTLESFPEKVEKCLRKCERLCVLSCQEKFKKIVNVVDRESTEASSTKPDVQPPKSSEAQSQAAAKRPQKENPAKARIRRRKL